MIEAKAIRTADARVEWTESFCRERGWPLNPSQLTLEQIQALIAALPWRDEPTYSHLPEWRRPLPPCHHPRPDFTPVARGPLPAEASIHEVDFARHRSVEEVLDQELEAAEEIEDSRQYWARTEFIRKVRGPIGRSYRTARAIEIAASDDARVAHHNLRDYRGGSLTVKQWVGLKRAFKGACAYCGTVCKVVIEHMVPLSRGGRTSVQNVVPSCWACNAEKGTSTVEEWLYGDRLAAFEARRRVARRLMRGVEA